MKNRLCFIVLQCLLMLVIAFSAATQVKAKVIKEGYCGPDVTYTIDDTQKLTISGSGKMSDYTFDKNMPPWYEKDIRWIEINEKNL